MKARVAIVGALVLASCGHAVLERGERRGDPKTGVPVSDVPVHGYMVEVYGHTDSVSHFRLAEGELIAVERGVIYVLLPEGNRISKVPFDQVERVIVHVQSSDTAAGAAAWTAGGCVSTLSHGYFLVFTGPLWLATGVPATVAETNASVATASRKDLDVLREYARFPQGRPESWGGVRRVVRREAPALKAPADAGVPTVLRTASADGG